MNSSWHIKTYQEGDEHRILRLRRAVWGDIDPVRLDLFTWYWQFRDNPAGKAFCFLAEDRGVIVGQYTATPTRFNIHDQETIFAFSCDTMTHPDYLRQGMFVTLARRLYDSIQTEAGIETVWGFPNMNSLHGFTERLGWNIIDTPPNWMSFTHPLAPFLPFLLPSRPILSAPKDPAKICFTAVTHFSSDFDLLWEKFKPRDRVIQVRDSRYLNWRYLGVKAFGYRPFAVHRQGGLAGYVVLRIVRLLGFRVGVLMDMFPLPLISPEKTGIVLKWIKRYCLLNGAAFVVCLIPPRHQYLLRRSGFRKVPKRLSPRTWILGCRCSEKQGPFLRKTENWHVLYGDSDIV